MSEDLHDTTEQAAGRDVHVVVINDGIVSDRYLADDVEHARRFAEALAAARPHAHVRYHRLQPAGDLR